MRLLAVVLGFILLLVSGIGTGYSEEAAPSLSDAESMQAGMIEPDIEWLWGEVLSVDEPGKAFKVKYLDYETDAEKEISLAVDEQTTYENAASLAQISAGDTVSVDYGTDVSGKALARNISVEKSDESAADQDLPSGLMPAPALPTTMSSAPVAASEPAMTGDQAAPPAGEGSAITE